MAKNSNAVQVINPTWKVITLPGGGQSVAFSADERKLILAEVKEVGNIILTLEQRREQKIRVALNLMEAFKKYKEVTKGQGLPAFVADCIDATCPRQYGKVGTPDRAKCVQHAIFRGVEALIKYAQQSEKIREENQKLLAAGVDVKDSKKVESYQKGIREDKASEFKNKFAKCIVDFDRHGVTETTIENFLINILGKKEKESDDLNKSGKELRDAAVSAVFKARGTKPAPAPTLQAAPPQSDLMTTLDKSIKAGNNAKIHAAVTPKAAKKK